MQADQFPKTFPMASITRVAASALLDAARTEAQKLNIEVTIAITDAAGCLKALDRTDGAPFLTVDVAIDKAWTAASFGLPTHIWASALADGKVAQMAHRPRLVAVGGGCPIIDDSRVVGGIGISGGTTVQDQQAAEAALKSLGFDVRT
jgi:uncharacterized protein GlcG (DUF336 family)